ncbi:hypothetical protein BV22DRAFT_345758 [Leucogyrophana mollusca]|uniref:Uncharacterized protein n=1 Tax=Leucogyrophana mollusca TaxID=85980 RepID=A0ACB8BM96_9AGAM|nr:hypothetical protein BV22DRAFT_345758 [Leucogyrophana mollusca]
MSAPDTVISFLAAFHIQLQQYMGVLRIGIYMYFTLPFSPPAALIVCNNSRIHGACKVNCSSSIQAIGITEIMWMS